MKTRIATMILMGLGLLGAVGISQNDPIKYSMKASEKFLKELEQVNVNNKEAPAALVFSTGSLHMASK